MSLLGIGTQGLHQLQATTFVEDMQQFETYKKIVVNQSVYREL